MTRIANVLSGVANVDGDCDDPTKRIGRVSVSILV